MILNYRYSLVWLNKASQQEKTAATSATNLSNQLQSNYNTTFANSQNIQGSLAAQAQRMTNMGLAGQGFLPGEQANLRSDSKEAAAQSDVAGEQGLQQALASQGHGGTGPSGATGALSERLASSAAFNDANAQRGITADNANLARANVTGGLGITQGLSGQVTGQADSLGGQAVGANQNSFHDETQAYQPSNFWGNLAGGLAGGVVNSFAPGLGGLASGGIKGLFGGGGPSNDDGYNGG